MSGYIEGTWQILKAVHRSPNMQQPLAIIAAHLTYSYLQRHRVLCHLLHLRTKTAGSSIAAANALHLLLLLLCCTVNLNHSIRTIAAAGAAAAPRLCFWRCCCC
jgi:hypothetical protein